MMHTPSQPTTAAWRLAYTRALACWDAATIVDALADDVVVHVAVHDRPMRGKHVADCLFAVLHEELGDVTVTDEIIEDDRATVVFETSIADRLAQGLNVVRLDASGAVGELTVFFRPLAALTLIADIVGARMAERLGPAGGGPDRGLG